MRIFRRALIFSTLFAQNFSTFGQNVSAFGEKCPTFSAPLHAALATRHKKRTAPQFIVQSFVFQSKHEAAFPLTSRGTRLLGCPCSRVKSLVHSFLCAFLGSSLGLGTDVLRVAFHDFGATLCSSFGVLLCGRFGFCSAAASGFLAFFASLFGLVCLIACGLRGLLTCGGSLLGAFLAARFHFFLSCIGIHLHHLSGSSGTYGENGGESQTAEQRVEIEFHCSVVLVVISIRIGVSFVKTHGVIFYRRHVFPVCACKCNT